MTAPRADEALHVRTLAALWSAALVVAILGTWLLYRAAPGVNWGLTTLGLSVALVGCAAVSRRTLPGTLLATVALALALAGGAELTADVVAHLVIALTVCGLLATATVLVRDPRPTCLDVWLVATLPLQAGARLGVEFLGRMGETLRLGTSSRWRPLVRGLALAVPIVGVFGLMLAGADPLLAAVRDELIQILTSWDVVPRTIFFGTLFVLTGGACGLAARGPVETPAALAMADRAGLGALERSIVLGSVALLFGGFLALQVSYFFGNLPAVAGSGVTFAEYARRGFAELTIVTTLSLLLVIGLDHRVARSSRGWRVRLVEVVLIGELALLLVSAFRRLLLYEDAYGFTTARLYGQASMVWLAAVLALVALELRHRLDGHRLLRWSAAAAALILVALIYWNHEAWIVRRNVARFTATRQFDARYVVWSLSPNALPALVAALDQLPAEASSSLRLELGKRYASPAPGSGQWYEWNVARARAERALRTLQRR